MLKLETGGERGLGDFELLRARVLGRKPVLQLVSGLGECAGERPVWMANHPAEQLGRDADGPELRCCPGRAAQMLDLFSAWIAPFIAYAMRRANRKDLALLKRLLEHEDARA